MIDRISDRVAFWLAKKGNISYEEQELYAYAVYSLLFGMLPVIIASIAGMVWGNLKESVTMIVPFMLVRKFSGGYHLKSARVCFCISTALITIFCGILRYVAQSEELRYISALLIISSICLFLYSPIDSEERKLDISEQRLFRRIARVMVVLFMSVYFLMVLSGKYGYAAAVGMGVILAALLQVPCILEKGRIGIG